MLFYPTGAKIPFCTVEISFRTWILPKEVFGLPNIKSAKKRVLVSETKAAQNKAAKSALKTEIKKANIAIESGENTVEAVRAAQKKIDQAVAKGLLHKNTAARKKAALAKKANG